MRNSSRLLVNSSLTWCSAALLMRTSPVAFGTNDDVVLRSLANGRYTGDFEWNTIFHPLFGTLTYLGYQLLPAIDWYVFLMFGLHLTSAKVIVGQLARGQEFWPRVLLLAFGTYTTLKLMYPIQFTGTAMMLALAGGFGLLDTKKRRQTRAEFVRSSVLLLLGFAIRFEAALIMVVLVVVPILVADTFQRPVGPTPKASLAKVLLSLAAPALFVFTIQSWLLDLDFHSRYPTIEVFSHAHTSLGEMTDSQVLAFGSELTSTDLELLRLSQGSYMDTYEKAVSMRDIARSNERVFAWRESSEFSVASVFGREYLTFHAILVVLLLLVSLRGRASLHALIPTGVTLMVLVCLVGPFLISTYDRLPYRLLMPVWAGVVFSAMRAYSRSATSPLAMSGRGNLSRATCRRAGQTVLLLSIFGSLTFGFRYLSFHDDIHDQQETSMIEKREWISCLANQHKFVMAIVPYSLFPGGGLVPVDADAVLEIPTLDSSWIVHTDAFKKRAAMLGLDFEGSLVNLFAANDAAVITDSETARKLADLHNQSSDRKGVVARPIANCGIEAWRLEHHT